MTIEYSSLIIGVGISTGLFAFKTGVGEYYFISRQNRILKKFIFTVITAIVYLTIFALSFFIVNRENFIFNNIAILQDLFKSGVYIHFFWAVALFIWGYFLLKSDHSHKNRKAWMLLAVPCPVCASAIFLVCAFLNNIFPEKTLLLLILSSGFFLMINFLTIACLIFFGRKFSASPEKILGNLMILIGAYFVLMLLIAPHFSEIKSVYRLSLYEGSGIETTTLQSRMTVFLFSVMTFITGFIYKNFKIRNFKNGIIRPS